MKALTDLYIDMNIRIFLIDLTQYYMNHEVLVPLFLFKAIVD